MGHTIKFEYQDAYSQTSIWDDGETGTLELLSSKFKRRGAAKKVLELTLIYADAFGIDLFLEVTPFGDGEKMSAPDLKAFYMTYGFQNKGEGVMFRPHQGVKNESS